MRRALLAWLVLAAPVAAQPITLGTEGAYPPYTFLDAQGAPQGLDIDLGNAICTRLKRGCTWVLRDWERLIPGLLAGEYDAIIAAMGTNAARLAQMDFTRTYEPPPAPSIFVGWKAFIDPDTATIAVQAATVQEDHLRETGRNVLSYPTAAAAFEAMMQGEAQLVFGPPSYLEAKVFRTSRALQIVAREATESGASAIAFRPEDPLRDAFDAALDEMWDDGSLEEIRSRWLPAQEDI